MNSRQRTASWETILSGETQDGADSPCNGSVEGETKAVAQRQSAFDLRGKQPRRAGLAFLALASSRRRYQAKQIRMACMKIKEVMQRPIYLAKLHLIQICYPLEQ